MTASVIKIWINFFSKWSQKSQKQDGTISESLWLAIYTWATKIINVSNPNHGKKRWENKVYWNRHQNQGFYSSSPKFWATYPGKSRVLGPKFGGDWVKPLVLVPISKYLLFPRFSPWRYSLGTSQVPPFDLLFCHPNLPCLTIPTCDLRHSKCKLAVRQRDLKQHNDRNQSGISSQSKFIRSSDDDCTGWWVRNDFLYLFTKFLSLPIQL